jgi:hypothetical protein
MSQNNGHVKRSEKGLLTADNCVVAFIDHQPQMLFGTSNFDRQSIINNTVALAEATRIFDVPVILTTVETKAFSGNMWPQLKAVYPDRQPIERSSMNSWDDRNFVAAVEKTGRKKLVLCGLWTETCIALPTIQALHDGYDIYVAEDSPARESSEQSHGSYPDRPPVFGTTNECCHRAVSAARDGRHAPALSLSRPLVYCLCVAAPGPRFRLLRSGPSTEQWSSSWLKGFQRSAPMYSHPPAPESA